jgi:NAD(P)-dependent dehydrogenase (short-subunit alcohol dehydrogenase family)
MQVFSSALITGAASGLGKAIALRLASAGSRLILLDADAAGLEATAALVRTQGSTAATVCGDVADDGTWSRAMPHLAAIGRLDLLANCAGVAAAGNVEDVGLDTWHWVMNTNFFGTVQACRAVLPLLKRQRSGCILNVASRAGISSVPQMAPYGASKAAVIALSETLYSELRQDGISVTVACPSYFRTGIARNMRSAAPQQQALARKFVDASGISADDMAAQVLAAAARGALYHFPPGEDRLLWRLKRAFPRFCLDLTRRKYLQALAASG